MYDVIKTINDPEHPLTLEQLNVVSPHLINVNYETKTISVEFTPTIPNCGLSTLIGLMIKAKLMNFVSSKWKIEVKIEKGKHYTEDAINKQLKDKERVCAALENKSMRSDFLKRNGFAGNKSKHEERGLLFILILMSCI